MDLRAGVDVRSAHYCAKHQIPLRQVHSEGLAGGTWLLKDHAPMYRKILVALDTTASDQELLPHIADMALLMQAELLLLHVADGWVARNFEQLNLSDSEEMRQDWKYLEDMATKLRATGLIVKTRLGLGSPPNQILKVADEDRVD